MKLKELLKQIALWAMLLFIGCQSAWAVGSSSASDIGGGLPCKVDASNPSMVVCLTPVTVSGILGNTYSMEWVPQSAQFSNDFINAGKNFSPWYKCENWAVQGMSSNVPGSTGNCWDFADSTRTPMLTSTYMNLPYYSKDGASLIDMNYANYLVNSGYTHNVDNPSIGLGCCSGLGLGTYQYFKPADVYDPSNTIEFQHYYSDWLVGLSTPGTLVSGPVFDVFDGGKNSAGRNTGSITFHESISGLIALVIGAGEHEGMFFDFNGVTKDQTINFDYADFGDGYQPANWDVISHVAVYSVNAAGSVAPAQSTVPEPSSLILMLVALIGLGLGWQRKESRL